MTVIDRPLTETPERPRPSTRWRPALVAGVAAGPLFVTTIVAQAISHPDFDLAEHPLSLLALGSNGWIQTANFIVCGAAFVLATLAERRTTRQLSTWTGRMMVTFGGALITAGLIPADPWHGYPVGAAESVTWHGVMHNIAPAVAGIALVIAAISTARAARRAGHSTWAAISMATGVGYLVLSVVGSATGDLRVAFAAGAAIWCWASAALAKTQLWGPPSQGSVASASPTA